MNNVSLISQLLEQGHDYAEIRRLRAAGDLHGVRRGAVSHEPPSTDPVRRHREVIAATLPQVHPDDVLSHVSAAVLHSLPIWAADLGAVHVTRPRSAGGGKRRTLIRLHTQPLNASEVVEIDGMAVTSLARTVFDLARAYPYERAVAAGDRAMALGLAMDDVAEMLDRGRRWAGIGQARRVTAFIEAGAESPGESVSRVRLASAGLPRPQLQVAVRLPNGQTAYADFGWPELGVLGEFDGLVKYQQLLRPGETAADAVIREKRREDALRALGWRIIRWIWSDLTHFGPVARLLQEALASGHPLPTLAGAPRPVIRTTSTWCG